MRLIGGRGPFQRHAPMPKPQPQLRAESACRATMSRLQLQLQLQLQEANRSALWLDPLTAMASLTGQTFLRV